MTIEEIIKLHSDKLDYLDIEVILAHSLGKPREFVLAHPEYKVTDNQKLAISKLIKRRISGEPIAYIIGHKEFYGLDFIVDKHTLIPRPETEMLVDLVTNKQKTTNNKNTYVIDIGTGSGNIIISIAHTINLNLRFHENDNIRYFGTDISEEALKVAKRNAKIHKLDKKIKFLHGNLLNSFISPKNCKPEASSLILVANLPYLSREVYASTPKDVKKYEPKSALFSSEKGLQHYRKLLLQIKKLLTIDCCSLLIILEISPEQKQLITKLIKSIFPKAQVAFEKDLAGKWRICKFTI